MDCIILCGGQGTRLRAVTDGRPKSMATVNRRPFLEWLLLSLRAQGLRRVILATGYRGEDIEAYFGDGNGLGIQIAYSHELSPRGTGGAIRLALESAASDRLLVLNGDSYCRFRLEELEAMHVQREALATLWLVPVADRGRFGAVAMDTQGRVRTFDEKGDASSPGLVNGGVYLIERRVIVDIPTDRPVAVETDVFPRLVGRGLYGVVGEGPLVDIGTPAAYKAAGSLMEADIEVLEREAGTIRKWQRVRDHLTGSIAIQRQTVLRCADETVHAAEMMASAFAAGHKVLLCGNGGSAADCQHMATEFTSRLSKSLDRPGLPAIALTTDTSFLTAFSNDCGFEGVFERQVRALGKPGDVLIAISTSGNSPNVVRAVQAARSINIKTIGLLGEGGTLTTAVDCAIVVPSRDTQFVQESLLPVEHAICDIVEQALYASDLIAQPLGAA